MFIAGIVLLCLIVKVWNWQSSWQFSSYNFGEFLVYWLNDGFFWVKPLVVYHARAVDYLTGRYLRAGQFFIISTHGVPLRGKNLSSQFSQPFSAEFYI